MWILNYDVDDHDYQVCDGDNVDDEADYIYHLRVWMLCDMRTPIHP